MAHEDTYIIRNSWLHVRSLILRNAMNIRLLIVTIFVVVITVRLIVMVLSVHTICGIRRIVLIVLRIRVRIIEVRLLFKSIIHMRIRLILVVHLIRRRFSEGIIFTIVAVGLITFLVTVVVRPLVIVFLVTTLPTYTTCNQNITTIMINQK